MALVVTKFMGKLEFTRRKLMGKLSLDYVRNMQEIKRIVCFYKLQNEGKGKGEARKGLWARARSVGCTPCMKEARISKI